MRGWLELAAVKRANNAGGAANDAAEKHGRRREGEGGEGDEGDPNCSLSLYLTLSLRRSLHASVRRKKERNERGSKNADLFFFHYHLKKT